MKIQIDTEKKIIKLENSVKLNELFAALEQMFPNAEWEEYSLETNYPLTTPWITYKTEGYLSSSNTGVFNIEY